MALTSEQIKELKAQLSEQIQHLPQEQKEQAQEQIDNMSPEALETMLSEQNKKAKNQLIFREIIFDKIPSKKIDENKYAIAVLDIRPISKGHTIIIPKSQIADSKNMPSQVFTLAKKQARKISSKLKAQGTEIQTEFKFGELIINVIPIYDKSLNISSPRYEASEKELEEVYKALKTQKRKPVIKRNTKKKTSNEKIIKISRRIP